MEFFQKKTTQIIALVTIIGTLAGFGYTGATYVNRLENLEKKQSRTILICWNRMLVKSFGTAHTYLTF